MIYNICGQAVHRARIERGLSRPDLARQCQLAGWDVSIDTIERIESRSRFVKDFEIKYLCKVLKISYQTLLD